MMLHPALREIHTGTEFVAGDVEWTIFTTVPPDLVCRFVEENLSPAPTASKK